MCKSQSNPSSFANWLGKRTRPKSQAESFRHSHWVSCQPSSRDQPRQHLGDLLRSPLQQIHHDVWRCAVNFSAGKRASVASQDVSSRKAGAIGAGLLDQRENSAIRMMMGMGTPSM